MQTAPETERVDSPDAVAVEATATPRPRAQAEGLGAWVARWGIGCALVLLLAASIATSLLGGHPGRLPAIALGSPALLYAAKAAAFLTIGLLVLVVLVRAFQYGDLPSEVTKDGLRWEVREVKRETDATVATLRGTVERLEQLGVAHGARLEVLEDAQELFLEELE